MLMTRVPEIKMDLPQIHPPRGSCCGMILKGISLLTWIPRKTVTKVCNLCCLPFGIFTELARYIFFPQEHKSRNPNCIWIKVRPEDRPPGYNFFYGFFVEKKVFNDIHYVQIGHLTQSNPHWEPQQHTSFIPGDVFIELEHRYVPNAEALFLGKTNP